MKAIKYELRVAKMPSCYSGYLNKKKDVNLVKEKKKKKEILLVRILNSVPVLFSGQTFSATVTQVVLLDSMHILY